MLTLRDANGAVGEVYFLGARGFAARRSLADPLRRRALIGELVTAVRLQQEVTRLRQENRQLNSILHFSGEPLCPVRALDDHVLRRRQAFEYGSQVAACGREFFLSS